MFQKKREEREEGGKRNGERGREGHRESAGGGLVGVEGH